MYKWLLLSLLDVHNLTLHSARNGMIRYSTRNASHGVFISGHVHPRGHHVFLLEWHREYTVHHMDDCLHQSKSDIAAAT